MALSIQELKKILESCPMEKLPTELEKWKEDSRKGVIQLLQTYQKRYEAEERENQRLEELLSYERSYYAKGIEYIAGIDEVGRGPLAGPVVAAAVILPKECKIHGINDSKKLSEQKREELYHVILEKALAYGIGVVSQERIDEINILQATYEAMRMALEQLAVTPQQILADAVTIPGVMLPQKGIVKGDAKSISIGAASILAKVTRDRMMIEWDAAYPQYGFASHKGYGSAEHIKVIKQQGLCPLHRRSFVKNLMGEGKSQSQNKQKGNHGERLAAKEMKRLGYEIVGGNYHSPWGEIDIIARKDGYLIFTEVKYRTGTNKGLPREAVHETKQKRMIETAKAYLAEFSLAEENVRFDVAELMEQGGKTLFHYIENAFGE
ncbi:MAG: ribonuclease HII [Epulopiscium sp.]|jgi:uncharacterized protein (TIGR00252 family)|nr:ribonuclease HII [Candidatus Epulonipiscium sp.]